VTALCAHDRTGAVGWFLPLVQAAPTRPWGEFGPCTVSGILIFLFRFKIPENSVNFENTLKME
jgi:hypothetical protein